MASRALDRPHGLPGRRAGRGTAQGSAAECASRRGKWRPGGGARQRHRAPPLPTPGAGIAAAARDPEAADGAALSPAGEPARQHHARGASRAEGQARRRSRGQDAPRIRHRPGARAGLFRRHDEERDLGGEAARALRAIHQIVAESGAGRGAPHPRAERGRRPRRSSPSSRREPISPPLRRRRPPTPQARPRAAISAGSRARTW